MARRITLEQWIKDACEDADKGAPLTALSLVFLKGIGTEEVHTKEISGPQNFRQLAEFFTTKACNYSQDLPGTASFRLLGFYGGKTEPQATHTFTTYEGEVTAGEKAPWSKHEPSPQGLLAQLMKHNEQIMSSHVQVTQGMLGMLMKRDEEHQKEKVEMNMIMRDILLNLRKEEHAFKLEQLKYERESTERQMLGRMAPALINHLTGREVVPTNHADSQIIEALAMKIQPQDLQLLVAMGKITQQEALVLAQRFTAVRDEHEKRSKLQTTLPPEESNGVKPPELS